jgi:hypothetical protein
VSPRLTELHQRADLVRHADLREADLARQAAGRRLVGGGAVAVHEHDGDAAQARVVRGLQLAAQVRLVERAHHRAVGGDPLVGLDHPRIQQLGSTMWRSKMRGRSW